MTRQHQSALSRLGFRDPDKENPRHGLACEYLQEKMLPYAKAVVAGNFQKAALNQISRGRYSEEGAEKIPVHLLDYLPEEISAGRGLMVESVNPLFLHEAAVSYIEGYAASWASGDVERCAELSSMVVGPSSGAKGFLDVSFRGKASRWYLVPELIPGEFEATCVSESGEKSVVTFTSSLRTDAYERYGHYGSSNAERLSFDTYHWPLQFCCWGEVRIEPTAPELLLQQIEFYASNLPKSDMIWVLADFDLADFKRMAQPQFPQLKCFQLGDKFEEWCQNRERTEIPEL